MLCMRTSLLLFLTIISVTLLNFRTASVPDFESGIIYSRSYFPDHPINTILKRMDFKSNNINGQYQHLRDSLKMNFRSEGDPMYTAAIFLMPVYTELHHTKSFSQVRQQTLGYYLEANLDRQSMEGNLYLAPQATNIEENIFVDFGLDNLHKLWEKPEIDEEEYTIRKEPGTARISGFNCSKMIYDFTGTSRKPVLHTKLISTIPWKITIWHTTELPSAVNVQLPYRFKVDGAVMKMEVAFEKKGSKKMVWEVTSVQPKEINIPELRVERNVLRSKFESDPQKPMNDLILFMGKTLESM